MDDAKKILWIADQLVRAFGHPTIKLEAPLENLVLTILSQNTTDTNRDRAFHSLMATFKTFEAVLCAPPSTVASAIAVGGLQTQKAGSIQRALERVKQTQGSLDLSSLADLPTAEAFSWLTSLSGVGPKTAGIVLLFSFDRPYFPADTHIRRVMSRMGIVSPTGDPHSRLNALLPETPRLMQELHLLTIRLGRSICHPRNPACARCPLQAECLGHVEHGKRPEDRVPSPSNAGGPKHES